MSPLDPTLLETAEEFKKGGWVVAVLGALGAFARLVISEEKWQAIIWIRKMIAGAIVGTLCYFALNSSSIDPLFKSILYASAGSLAPDIFAWIKRKFTQQAK
jgi:hypothetical protein